MRKSLSLLLILTVFLNIWGGVQVSASLLYTKTTWINVGSSYEYYYFNITLEDIDVFGSAAMIGVTGMQGSQDIVLQTSGQKSVDVFGDGTITITLLDLSSSSAKITIAVDVETLATVAGNVLESKIQEAENAGLPASKINEYNNTLKAARNYVQLGEYINAIELCKETIALINSDIPLAKEAMIAINNATLIINNPRLVDENCTSCPSSITSEAENKLNQAKSAFNSGDFTSAKELAVEAAKVIENFCKSCKIYPEKEKEVENFLKSQPSIIPLDPAWNKLKNAKYAYENGNCVVAIQDLDSAKSLAEDIITGWNKANSCKNELISMISEAKGKYVVSYGTNEKVQIALGDIEKQIYPEISQYMKKGYFSTAVTNCNALKTQVANRINLFTQTWKQMNISHAVLMSLQGKGYKIDDAWKTFNKAIEMFKNGSYTSASVEFEKAKNIAEQIKSNAEEAQRWKNKTEACLLDLKTKGVNVDFIFGEDINKAENLYASGEYPDAEQQWKLVDKKCHDPGITDAINKRESTMKKYSQIKAEKIDIPKNITMELKKAEEYFMKGDFSDAGALYDQVTALLTALEKTSKETLNEIKESETFISSELPKYTKMAKLLGIPQLKMRVDLLEKLTKNATIAYNSGDYSKAQQYISEIKEIRNDVDGDGIPDDVDILPQLPNYYLFGGIGILLLFLINIVK